MESIQKSASTTPVLGTPTETPRIRPGWILWPLISHGALMVGAYLFLVVTVPKFASMFATFDVSLPQHTVFVIAATRILSRWAVVILPLGAGFLVGDVVLYCYLRREGLRSAAIGWLLCVSLLPLVATGLALFSLYQPWASLMQKVGESAAH